MNVSFLATVSIAMGFMVSPESLAMFGNKLGSAGLPFLGAVVIASAFFITTSVIFGKTFSLFPGPAGEALFIKHVFGNIPAVVFPLSARVTFTLCASTAMLVTAGFVFNEVFLYWFPNFGFASLLLCLLLICNLLGQSVAEKLQVLFMAVALTGLLVLSFIGLLSVREISAVPSEGTLFSLFPAGMYAMLIFIGFDLAFFRKTSNSEKPLNSASAIITGIILAGITLCLWGVASYMHTPPEKLAETTIPYTVAARDIFSQKGRIIMGIVLIAGTCGVVNALFIAVSRMISAMAAEGLLPRLLSIGEQRSPIPLIFMAGGIALMMASGLAGEEELEIYFRAGLFLWLINYAVVYLCLLCMKLKLHSGPQMLNLPVPPSISFVGLLLSSSTVIGLLWTDRESTALLSFMLIILAVMFVSSFVWKLFMKRGGEISL